MIQVRSQQGSYSWIFDQIFWTSLWWQSLIFVSYRRCSEGSTVWFRSPEKLDVLTTIWTFLPPAYLFFIVLPAKDDEEYEEAEDEDDEAEEDGGDEAEDDVALLCQLSRAGGGVGQGQGLAPVTPGGCAALRRRQ